MAAGTESGVSTPPKAAPRRRRTAAGQAADNARTQRARRALLKGARKVFIRDGFHEARIADVAAEAGVGIGTFYRYFSSKSEILLAAITEVTDEIYDGGAVRGVDDTSLARRIQASNESFFDIYARNKEMMSLLEQLAPSDPEFGALYLRLRERTVSRVTRAIRRWQDEGHVTEDLDPASTARVLTAMTNQHAHLWFNIGDTYDPDADPMEVTRVWLRALGIDDPE